MTEHVVPGWRDGKRPYLARLLCVLLVMSSSRAAHAQTTVFGSLFTEVLRDGALSTTPTGATVAAASSFGAGGEIRWAADASNRWLSMDFFQVVPSTPRGKSFQPFGAVGPELLSKGGERALGLNLAAGVLVFLTDHLGAVVDYRYFKARGTLGGVALNARTISVGFVYRL